MWIIKDIAQEFVIHRYSVFEIGSFKGRIRELFAQLTLEYTHGFLNDIFLEVVANDQYVETAFTVLDKESRDDEEMDASCRLKSLGKFCMLKEFSFDEQLFELAYIREVGIEEPSLDALLGHFARTPIGHLLGE